MRVIIKPSLAPQLHVDVTNALVAAIAHELFRAQQGNDVLNWLEAERILKQIVRQPAIGVSDPGPERGRAALSGPRAEREHPEIHVEATNAPPAGRGVLWDSRREGARVPAAV